MASKQIMVSDSLTLQPVRVGGSNKVDVYWTVALEGMDAFERWRKYWRHRRDRCKSLHKAARICRKFADKERRRVPEQAPGAAKPATSASLQDARPGVGASANPDSGGDGGNGRARLPIMVGDRVQVTSAPLGLPPRGTVVEDCGWHHLARRLRVRFMERAGFGVTFTFVDFPEGELRRATGEGEPRLICTVRTCSANDIWLVVAVPVDALKVKQAWLVDSGRWHGEHWHVADCLSDGFQGPWSPVKHVLDEQVAKLLWACLDPDRSLRAGKDEPEGQDMARKLVWP